MDYSPRFTEQTDSRPAFVFCRRKPGYVADALEIDLSRVLAFTYAYACLNASWWSRGTGAEDAVKWSLDVATIIEPHIELV